MNCVLTLLFALNINAPCGADDSSGKTVSLKSAVPVQEITICDNGKSKYKIVVSDDASPTTWRAVMELRLYVYLISGAVLPIVNDEKGLSANEIIIGNNPSH